MACARTRVTVEGWGMGAIRSAKTPLCVCLLLQYLFQRCSRGGGGGKQWRTCATRDYEPRPVWTSLPNTH
jgi:hypothetical protein